MITENDLHKSPALIKALTGLPGAVFWELIDRLEAAYPEYERRRHERGGRQRAVGAGPPYTHSLVMRTLLVLVYLRLHIPQEVVANLFGGSQPEVSRELRRLRPLLEQVLPVPAVWEILPEEQPVTAKEVLDSAQLLKNHALVDATEQRVYRPQKDNETRKKFYSGKKKAFTLKTEIVSTTGHKIVAISEAVAGAVSDKKLSDEVKTLTHLPVGCKAVGDKGYQGLDKSVTKVTVRDVETGEEKQVLRVQVRTPFKKPKGGELTELQKTFNRVLGAVRVRVEHCIGWIKNWGIIATRFRCDHRIYTPILRVVCGLVNWQTERWQAAKESL